MEKPRLGVSPLQTMTRDTVDRKIQPFTIHHVMQHVDHVPCHGYNQLVYNFDINVHNDHRARAGVDIVREYEVRLGSLQIQMKFYLEKMKLR